MTKLAENLMTQFVEATGVTGEATPRRYLWTDAFAVCNCLELFQVTRKEGYRVWAKELVAQVHAVLGHHRADDSREGWLSGLEEREGWKHPTRGGLRIGKKLKERSADEPLDSRREWDRDGQYFHYLTKWMHALYRVSRVLDQDEELVWAAELDHVAHRAFTYELPSPRTKRMYWKMSVDLSRPLVSSMGHHDPLDGLIISLELQTDERLPDDYRSLMNEAVGDFDQMTAHGEWATGDPLGIGGLLDSAIRLFQMICDRNLDRIPLLVRLLEDSLLSLRSFCESPTLTLPAEQRLAFRELGLAIGLRGLGIIDISKMGNRQVVALLERLTKYSDLAEQIISFWSVEDHHRTQTWKDHEDINSVMLATALIPEGALQV